MALFVQNVLILVKHAQEQIKLIVHHVWMPMQSAVALVNEHVVMVTLMTISPTQSIVSNVIQHEQLARIQALTTV